MLAWIALLVSGTQAGGPTLPEQAVRRLVPLRFRHEAALVDAVLASHRLYSLDAAGYLSAWETGTDRRLWRVGAPGARSLAASADGSTLVLAGPDGLRIVEVASGAERRRLAGAARPALSADGRLLAAVDGRTIRRWRVETGAELPRLESTQEIGALAVSGDGARIAAADAAGWTVWEGGTSVARAESAVAARSLAFRADGRRLAVGDLWDARVYDLGASSPKLLQEAALTAGNALAFSRNGEHLVTLHRGRLAQAWSLARGEVVGEWRVHGDFGAERLVLSGDGEAILRIRGDGLQIHTFSDDGATEVATAATFLPDGRALTASPGRLRVWDLATGWSEASPAPALRAVAFSSDARFVLLQGEQDVAVWDRARSGELFRAREERLEAAALSLDGGRAALHAGGRTSIWDLARSVPLRVQTDPGREASALAFSPDGKVVARGHADGALTLMDVESGRDIHRFSPRGKARISIVAFTPDGKRMVTGDGAGAVRVWVEGREPFLAQSHGHAVGALAFSSDGRRLAGGARLSLAVTSSEGIDTAVLRSTGEAPTVLAFSPDGRLLLSADRAGAILIWALPDAK